MCELVGYGNSAGFLLTKGFSAPSKRSVPTVSPSSTTSDAQPAPASPKAHVSPFTALEADPSAPMHDPTMTDEEKEREAERLFVLFERIKKNPAVSLGDGKDGTLDPVRSAVESGRFQEMDESVRAPCANWAPCSMSCWTASLADSAVPPHQPEDERKRLDAQDAADEAEALREVQAVRGRRGEGAKPAD
jgi:hypothetical protein